MKKGLKLAIVLTLTFVLCISFAACDGETLESLKNEYGILVEGGGFKEGSTLVSKVIELVSDEGKEALEAIKNLEYNKDGKIHIYDISVVLDGVEVQPDGKVKVTLPAPDDGVDNYDVFHIKDSGIAEKLVATLLDGKVIFETDSFSMFVVVEGVKHSFFAKCTPDDGGYITENGEMVEFDGERMVADGTQITLTAVANADYAFKGWYYYDKNQVETLISADATHTFTVTEPLSTYAKFEEKEKHSFFANCIPGDGGYITENGEMVEFDGERMVADGTQITLTAVANTGYTFKGWYYYDKNQVETLISADATHTFTVTEPLSTYAKFEEKTMYTFLAQCDPTDGGYIIENEKEVDFGNGRMVDPGTQITLTAVANKGFVFVGWGTRDDDWKLTIISADATHTFVVTESTYVQAVFEEEPNGLKLDAHNAGFTYDEKDEPTTTIYRIGSEFQPDAQKVLVYATYPTQEDKYLTLNEDYTIDLGGLDFAKIGTYTITFTHKADNSLQATLTVQVVDKDYHEHTFSREWSSNETHHWHAATCGHDEKADYAEHYYEPDGWAIVKPATETEVGDKVRVCIGCKYEDHAEIPKLEHVHTFSQDWENDGEYHWHAATCAHTEETDGKALCSGGSASCARKAVCSVCGNEYGDTLDHDFTNKVISDEYLATPATCLAHATYYYSCKVCGAKGTETFEDTSGKLAYCNYNEADVCTVCEVPASAWLKFKEIKESNEIVAYKVTGYVSSYNNRKTEYVRVPSTYNGKPVVEIGENALYFSNIRHVVLPDSIVTLGNNIPLPQHIETLVIGSGLKNIAHDSFGFGNGGCTLLRQITISEDNPYFKMVDGVMYSKDGKTLVKYPALTEGEEFVIDSNVEKIWSYAFSYTVNLKSVVIPDSVTEILEYAFLHSNMTSVDIGSGVETISEAAFNSTCLKAVVLEGNIKTICEGAFAFSGYLASVSFGEKVETIGKSAFASTALTEIIIPDNVTSLGESAFQNTGKATKVVIGSGITEIPQKAFYNTLCGSNSSTLIIGGNVKTIGSQAFSSMRINSLDIPASVTTIGYSAFSNCGFLTSVVIPDTVKSIGALCFSNCESLESVTLNNVLTEIPASMFSSCTSLKSITIPNCVKIIGGGAFAVCTSLETVNFGTGLTTIGERAFENCYALTSITIPDGVETIEQKAFENCYALTSITIPDGVETIEHYAFKGCSALKTVVLPSSIHKISTATFKNCKALESVTFATSEPKVLYFEYDAVYSYTFDSVEKTTDMLSNKVSVLDAYYMYTIAAFNNDHKYHPITDETEIVRWEDRETE